MNKFGTRIVFVITAIVIVLTFCFALWIDKLLADAIEKQGIEQAEIHAKTLLGSLKTLMLNGNGTLTKEWLDRLHGVAGIENVGVLRRNGVTAFTDLETIRKVNEFLGWQRFRRNAIKPNNNVPNLSERVFRESLSGKIVHDLSTPGIITIVAPINSDDECLRCHGYDSSPLRGVLTLSLSLSSTIQRIDETKSIVWYVAVSLVLILAISLWLYIRMSVIKPITVLQRAITAAGTGDRVVKIPVTHRDELGDLAKVFNNMQKNLVQGEALIRSVMDNVVDGVIIITDKGIIDAMNPAMENLFGYASSALVGRHINVLLDDKVIENKYFMFTDNRRTVDKGNFIGVSREMIGKKKNSSSFPIDIMLSDMHLGNQSYYIGVVRDITTRKARVKALHYQATHDALTGLPNRTLLLDRLKNAISIAERKNHKLTLMLLDLNNFKHVNDSFGHQVGDELLIQFSQQLKSALRITDTVARLGGDEFCILLPTSHVKQAIIIARKVTGLIKKEYFIEGHYLSVGISLGLVSSSGRGETPQELLHFADEAMYEAKREKRDFVIYTHSD